VTGQLALIHCSAPPPILSCCCNALQPKISAYHLERNGLTLCQAADDLRKLRITSELLFQHPHGGPRVVMCSVSHSSLTLIYRMGKQWPRIHQHALY
jgi:hypothetical protein